MSYAISARPHALATTWFRLVDDEHEALRLANAINCMLAEQAMPVAMVTLKSMAIGRTEYVTDYGLGDGMLVEEWL